MLPALLGVIAGTGLISAGVNAYFTNKNANDQRSREDEIRAIQEKAYAALQAPPGTVEPLTFEEYSVLKQYNPQVASYVEEKSPELIGESQSAEVKQLQLQALDQYKQQSQTGSDPQLDAERAKLVNDLGTQQRQSQAGLMREYAQRGLGGGGQELFAQLANQNASQEQAFNQAQNQVTDSANRRRQALDSMANLAGSVRGQNLNVEQANNNVINQYNQRNATNRNAYAQYVAQQTNEGQRFNIGQNQQAANLNTGLRNDTTKTNAMRAEAAADKLRSFNNEKTLGMAGVQTAQQKAQGQIQANENAGYGAAVGQGLGALADTAKTAVQSGALGLTAPEEDESPLTKKNVSFPVKGNYSI